MTNVDNSIKEKLILATIECIENEGLHSVTIRKIAENADANSASISYYFGSKENLIKETLNHTLDHSFSDLCDLLEDDMKDPYSTLETLFEYLLKGAFDNSEIVKAHFYEPYVNSKYSQALLDWYTKTSKLICELISPHFPNITQEEIRFSINQILSTILFQSFYPDFSKHSLDGDLENPEYRKKYIKHLISKLIKIDYTK